MQIGPQDSTIDALDYLEKMMVIAPVDADENKTQHVTKKQRGNWDQGPPTGVVRYSEFEHHDGDDDRNHPITESFQAASGHPSFIPQSMNGNLTTRNRLAPSCSRCPS